MDDDSADARNQRIEWGPEGDSQDAPDGAFNRDSHEAICQALFEGRKIESIKLHRAATGSDLRGAKEAVEALEAELRASDPSRFLAPPKAGCLGAIAVAFALTGFASGLACGLAHALVA